MYHDPFVILSSLCLVYCLIHSLSLPPWYCLCTRQMLSFEPKTMSWRKLIGHAQLSLTNYINSGCIPYNCMPVHSQGKYQLQKGFCPPFIQSECFCSSFTNTCMVVKPYTDMLKYVTETIIVPRHTYTHSSHSSLTHLNTYMYMCGMHCISIRTMRHTKCPLK